MAKLFLYYLNVLSYKHTLHLRIIQFNIKISSLLLSCVIWANWNTNFSKFCFKTFCILYLKQNVAKHKNASISSYRVICFLIIIIIYSNTRNKYFFSNSFCNYNLKTVYCATQHLYNLITELFFVFRYYHTIVIV